MTEITEAEVEAGANVLAKRYFLTGEPWPLSRFPLNQQTDFRDKARAVLDAAIKVRQDERSMRVPKKDDPFLIANAGRMFELLSGVDHHPFETPINEPLRKAIQDLFGDAYKDGIDTITVSEGGLTETTDPSPEELVKMFGGTFHAFDAWLLTRPDLKSAGTSVQLDEYAAFMVTGNERPSDWIYGGHPFGDYLYWLEPDGTRHEATEAELADWRHSMAEMKRVASARRAARSRSVESWENEGGLVSGQARDRLAK